MYMGSRGVAGFGGLFPESTAEGFSAEVVVFKECRIIWTT